MAQLSWQQHQAQQAYHGQQQQPMGPGLASTGRPAGPQAVAAQRAGLPGQQMAPQQGSMAMQQQMQKRPVPPGAEQGTMKMQRQGMPGVPPTAGVPNAAAAQAPPAGYQVQQPPQVAAQQAQQQPQTAAGQQQQQQQPPAGGVAAAPAKDTYIVYTTGQDKDEVVVRTLVGQFVEKGVNHGRKVYQKTANQASPDHVDVLLYYWDSRDGPAFEGWWFGNKLGGTQVWSHCKDSGLLPPGAGWKIPWDGQVRPTLCVVSKEVQMKAAAEERLNKLAAEVTKVEAEANAALEKARAASGESPTIEALAEAEKELAPHVPALNDLVRKVADSQRFAVGDTMQGFQKLSNQVKTTQTSVNNEHTKLKTTQEEMEHKKKQEELEARDGAALDEFLPEAIEKTNTAEDMVEKAAITAEMIEVCGDDQDVVKDTLEQVETLAKTAQTSIGEARIYLNSKQAIARRFAEQAKERATTELSKLQKQLHECQNKLNPLKTIRTDHEARKRAAEVVMEAEEKVAMAEVDVDRAEEYVGLLRSETPTKEGLAQAQQAIVTAEDHVGQAMRLVQTKKTIAGAGVGLEELQKLEPRGEAAKSRVAGLKTAMKEAGERVTVDAFINEAQEQVQKVTDELSKLEDAEGGEASTEGGSGASTLEQALEGVTASEAAAAQATTAASGAKMFIRLKGLDVKRFSTNVGNEATEKLQELQKSLEAAMARLGELKEGIARRKRLALVREAETQVSKVEELLEQLKEAANAFADDARLMEMSPEEIREACEKCAAKEKELNDKVNEVRKFVTGRQIEAKGKETSAEVIAGLADFQKRLSNINTEGGKQRKLYSNVEQRMAMNKIVEETEKRLKACEEKVQSTSEAVATLGQVSAEGVPDASEKEKDDVAVKEAEALIAESTLTLKNLTRQFESKMGPTKDAIKKLEPRIKACQASLDAAQAAVKERTQGLQVRTILGECQQKVSEVETAIQKAEEAQAPLLESDEPKSATALTELDKLAQGAVSVCSQARTQISMKKLTAKRLPGEASTKAVEGLTKLLAVVEEHMKKSQDMRQRIAEWKRASAKGGGKSAAPWRAER